MNTYIDTVVALYDSGDFSIKQIVEAMSLTNLRSQSGINTKDTVKYALRSYGRYKNHQKTKNISNRIAHLYDLEFSQNQIAEILKVEGYSTTNGNVTRSSVRNELKKLNLAL